ncbi:MAG: hypothetical protein ACREH4_03095 [Vitreimonas sp.]
MTLRSRVVAYAGLAAAACSPASAPQEADPPSAVTAPAAPASAAGSLPAIDAARIQASLGADDTLETATFERTGSTTLSGRVEGYKAAVWAVPVAAGQTLSVDFQTTSTNLYMNVQDAADTSGAALHRGASATFTATRDTVYLIRPFQPRASARRNESGAYTIVVSRS